MTKSMETQRESINKLPQKGITDITIYRKKKDIQEE